MERWKSTSGAKNRTSKLDEQKAVEIFLLRGKMTAEEVAVKYGVSVGPVRGIWSKRYWAKATRHLWGKNE